MAKSDSSLAGEEASKGKARKARRVRLRSLNQRAVAVHLVINGRERVVRGRGAYESESKLGGLLRIDCADDNGKFEVLIREAEFAGEIERGAAFGCDYVVHLTVPK
jgi:hypothetical protein